MHLRVRPAQSRVRGTHPGVRSTQSRVHGTHPGVRAARLRRCDPHPGSREARYPPPVGEPDIAETRAELKAILLDKGRKEKLFAHAARFARGSETPDDLLNTACIKLLSGTTPWRRSTHPDLVAHLGSVMFTIANHAKTSADARRQRKFHTPEEETRVPDTRDGADVQLLDDEAERRMEQRLGRWLVALRKDRADDSECQALLDSFERGVTEAAKQVDDLGWDIDDVRRVRRRLFERAETVMRENPDDSGQYVARGAAT
jgi:hypothetical protein